MRARRLELALASAGRWRLSCLPGCARSSSTVTCPTASRARYQLRDGRTHVARVSRHGGYPVLMIGEIAIGVGLFTAIVLILALFVLFARARLVRRGSAGNYSQRRARTGCSGGWPAAGGACDQQSVCAVAVWRRRELRPVPRRRARGRRFDIAHRDLTHYETGGGRRAAAGLPGGRGSGHAGSRSGRRVWRETDGLQAPFEPARIDVYQGARAGTAPGETLDFRAGAYVQVDCPPYRAAYADFDVPDRFRDDWQKFGFLELEAGTDESTSRAYSMANWPAENTIVTLNVRIATPPPRLPADTPPGIVSSYLFSLGAGDTVSIAGPFGHFFARDTDAEMIFIGGGAGMAPMRSLIFDQLQRVGTTRRMSFWYGARSLREAFYVEDSSASRGSTTISSGTWRCRSRSRLTAGRATRDSYTTYCCGTTSTSTLRPKSVSTTCAGRP